MTANGNERGTGRRRGKGSGKRRGKGRGLTPTGRRNRLRRIGVMEEVMEGKMEGELKEERRTGRTELRGTDEGEGVPMKRLIKARTDIACKLAL